MTENDRPTIGEQYRRAVNATSLELDPRTSKQADTLMAAGWADHLGVLLHRLAQEFDQVKGDVRRIAANQQTEKLLILMHLKTLREAQNAVAMFALQTATRQRFMLADKPVISIAGSVLLAWLDPLCARCGGVGYVGGYDGEVRKPCRSCGCTGKTTATIGHDDEQRRFARFLAAELDAKTKGGEIEMARKKRLVKSRKSWLESQENT